MSFAGFITERGLKLVLWEANLAKNHKQWLGGFRRSPVPSTYCLEDLTAYVVDEFGDYLFASLKFHNVKLVLGGCVAFSNLKLIVFLSHIGALPSAPGKNYMATQST
ncbi:hypothetical protein MKW98_022647 [Papaver atlanticum]|uniref:Uncharacterized protein n=1 Tax=Papaver atlanticum TaxID=357466 RepID=A0AAD4XR97_9MAGN|nr:hypothetical protein MKW98_022647 [Papaver atlanticum]